MSIYILCYNTIIIACSEDSVPGSHRVSNWQRRPVVQTKVHILITVYYQGEHLGPNHRNCSLIYSVRYVMILYSSHTNLKKFISINISKNVKLNIKNNY